MCWFQIERERENRTEQKKNSMCQGRSGNVHATCREYFLFGVEKEREREREREQNKHASISLEKMKKS